MRILKGFVFTALLCQFNVGIAQNKITIVDAPPDDHTWMGHYYRDILKSMGLIYRTTDTFEEVKGSECFNDNPKLKEILTCVSHHLYSKDKEFVVFIPIYKPFSRQDSIEMKQMMPGGNFDHIDKQHTNSIRRDIGSSLGKDASLNWKQYVTYYSAKEAKTKFNADSAVFVPIKLDPQDYYKGKYNHMEALYLQKKGRGFVNFYCFYTDKAKKKLPQYRKAIEEIFRYED
ncbi:hypothetical protein [Pedobacter frigoris]|uniref:hypothetical protein n=1 Tax=Pedobacter frigoris TaxID=2571272 RepID=UPI0029319422|nr:hypothetical protein [Pedobacter frigoris]